MLVIRHAQLEQLGEAASIDAAARHLTDCLPGQFTDADAVVIASQALARAKRHGVVEYYDYLRFLNLEVVLGSDFSASPEYAAILRDQSLPVRARMSMATVAATDALEALAYEAAQDSSTQDLDEPADTDAGSEELWIPPEPDDAWTDGPDGSETQELKREPPLWERASV